MENVSSHEMVLVNTHASGAEEWLCPQCGRRFMMQWPPNYQMIVLAPGDLQIPHVGGKGGLRMGAPQLTQVDDDTVSEDSLRLWLDALKDIEFDGLGDEQVV